MILEELYDKYRMDYYASLKKKAEDEEEPEEEDVVEEEEPEEEEPEEDEKPKEIKDKYDIDLMQTLTNNHDSDPEKEKKVEALGLATEGENNG